MTDDAKQQAWELWIENHPVTRPARWAFDAGWDAAEMAARARIATLEAQLAEAREALERYSRIMHAFALHRDEGATWLGCDDPNCSEARAALTQITEAP